MKNAIPEFAVLQLRDLDSSNPIYSRLHITVEEKSVTYHPKCLTCDHILQQYDQVLITLKKYLRNSASGTTTVII